MRIHPSRIHLAGLLVTTMAAALIPAASASAVTGPAWTAAPALPLPGGATNSILRDVTVLSPNDVWAAGAWWDAAPHPLIVRWDGARWERTPVPDAPTPREAVNLTAIDGITPGDIWAVGSTESPDDGPSVSSPLALHYDGTDWDAVPLPAATDGARGVLNDVDMRTADDGWAVGQTAVGSSAPQPMILRWRSGQWQPVPAPRGGPTAVLTSVFAGSADDAWAVGTQTTASGRRLGLVLHWDGATWATATVPAVGAASDDGSLQSVAATSPTDVWAAGSTCGHLRPSNCAPLVLHFTRGAWTAVPTAAGATLTEVVPFSATDVWVLGQSNSLGSSRRDHVEHWDGQRFTRDGTVSAGHPPMTGNGELASLLAIAAAAGDARSGVLWAVGWVQNPVRTPHVIYRA